MKWSFMTLGCPDWDLDTICKRGKEYGFNGVDLRGLKEEVDITLTKEFSADCSNSINKLKDHGLEVSALSSSITLCKAEALESNVEAARRYISLALELNCKNIRVFGMGNIGENAREQLLSNGIKCMEAILEQNDANQLQWLLETHDDWVLPEHSSLLIEGVRSPSFNILWDMCHTFRIANQTPNQVVDVLKTYIKYVHVKDAIQDPSRPHAMPGGWNYVAPGEGHIPLIESVNLVRKHCNVEWLTYESEKRWRKHDPEPEEVFLKFVKWAQNVLSKMEESSTAKLV
jgi:sugar phosphate isomerase/epimerase